MTAVRLRNVRKLRLDRAHAIRFQQHVVPVVDVTNFVHAVILPHSQPVAVVGIRHDVAGWMMDFHKTVFPVPDVRCDVAGWFFDRELISAGRMFHAEVNQTRSYTISVCT